jgi:uncharacterized membrane protein YfcA
VIEFSWIAAGILLFSATLGGLVRRLSGFGGALIMSPLLMWFFPVPFFIPIVMSAELLGGMWLFTQWKVNKEDIPSLYRMWVLAAILLPFGIFLGEAVPITALKITTGIVVIAFSIFLLIRVNLAIKLSAFRDSLAGALSGLLLGSCGIGGPPVALYLNASGLQFERSRALLSQFVSGVCLLAIVAASLLGGGIAWLPWLLFALPAYFFGMFLAKVLLQRRELSAGAIKKFCLYLLIVNAAFNLGVLALLQG